MGDKSHWHKNDSYKRASTTCDEQHYQTDVANAWHCARLVTDEDFVPASDDGNLLANVH